jgi:hypothetical protein
MIHNIEGSGTAEALIALERSAFDFRLNGSRYFGTCHEQSDWDFYCNSNDDITEYLEYSGFRLLGREKPEEPMQINRNRYFGNSTNRTHKVAPDFFPFVPPQCNRSDVVAVYRRFNIDVQVVKDAELRAVFLKYLKDNVPSYKKIPKNCHKVVYRFFFDILYGNVKEIGNYPELVVNFAMPFEDRLEALPDFKGFAKEFYRVAA